MCVGRLAQASTRQCIGWKLNLSATPWPLCHQANHNNGYLQWACPVTERLKLKVMKSSLICYCHRQIKRKAYRLQARSATTGPDLQLTAIRSSDLPFNGRHPRNTWITTHLRTPETEGSVGLFGRPRADTLPTKLSHVNYRSGVDQGKSASQRPTS